MEQQTFEYFTIARIIHIIAVILWIGGVSMVTTVLIPAIRKMRSQEDQVEAFEIIEGRFAFQARITTLLAGISGFYMLHELNGWGRYLEFRYWWIHAMTLVWILFSLILYVLEPLVLHKVFRKYADENPEGTFRIMHRLHWILLIISLITTTGAIAGSHGWFLVQ